MADPSIDPPPGGVLAYVLEAPVMAILAYFVGNNCPLARPLGK